MSRLVLAACLALSPVLAAADDPPILTLVKGKLKHPDQPFVMVVTIKLKPGTQSKFEAAFAGALAGTRTEPGNLAYALSRSADNDAEYTVYERWKNVAALADHLKAPHMVTALGVVAGLVDGPPAVAVSVPVGD